MNVIYVIQLDQPLRVSPAALRRAVMSHVSDVGSQDPRHPPVYLPVEFPIAVSDLETPWESPLEGLRIANFNGTGLRTLERRAGKVIHSARIDDPESVFRNFTTTVRNSWWAVSRFIDGPRVYSTQTCVDLLKGSFLNAEKPRLVPRLVWPEQAQCLAIVRELVRDAPWKLESQGSTRELTLAEGRYRFEVRGERGEVESTETSTNLDEILSIICFDLVGRRYVEGDSRFIFDAWRSG